MTRVPAGNGMSTVITMDDVPTVVKSLLATVVVPGPPLAEQREPEPPRKLLYWGIELDEADFGWAVGLAREPRPMAEMLPPQPPEYADLTSVEWFGLLIQLAAAGLVEIRHGESGELLLTVSPWDVQ